MIKGKNITDSDANNAVKSALGLDQQVDASTLYYSKSEINELFEKQVILNNIPIVHSGTTVSTKLFEQIVDPQISIDGYLYFYMTTKHTNGAAKVISLRINNVAIIQTSPSTQLSGKFDQYIYNKHNSNIQGAANLGSGWGVSSSALQEFSFNTTQPLTISVWATCPIGETITLDFLVYKYKK